MLRLLRLQRVLWKLGKIMWRKSLGKNILNQAN
ncbi:hypothetical protein OIU77_002094, partial [Salix suchowensis]